MFDWTYNSDTVLAINREFIPVELHKVIEGK